ncbi:hypothetical protein SLS56_002403 [Neofusicoccum ribis]|uniref:Zn(II)2Cys6 transcription factor n=1 Tax=Neofusicoccum ribis TaxID=45134 RepID=A0ABR3T4E7_9PEZI
MEVTRSWSQKATSESYRGCAKLNSNVYLSQAPLQLRFNPQGSDPVIPPSDLVQASTPIDAALNVWTSPFASPSAIIRNTHKNKRKWNITGLPSMDHALYLFNTVKFHLSYRFFDDGEFTKNVHEFYYGKAQEKATESRLWFVQFLIILAFGNALVRHKSRTPRKPRGAKYFVRAMSLMPDHTSMWKDSLLGIEVLILAGLYLYSIDQKESAHVYVKLSQLSSVILTTIYKTEKTQLSVFLERTRSILHVMAGHAQEIENIFHDKFRNSVEAMPPGIRHITLLYHQCVIVATRPLLLSVLKERLERLGREKEGWQSILAHTTSLISTGIKSAAKTLQILSDEDIILEVFLPFDLEFTYGAALHLIMANALFPGDADEQSYQKARVILDEMISEGNRVAEVRKAELVHLEELCWELAMQSERQGLQSLTLAGPEGPEIGANNNSTAYEADQVVSETDIGTATVSIAGSSHSSPPSTDPAAGANFEFLDNIGISSSEFLSIVDQMGSQDILLY